MSPRRGILGNVATRRSDLSDSRREVIIRRAEPSDATALVDLQRQIYREERWFVGDGAPAVATMAQRLRTGDPGMSLWLLAAGSEREQAPIGRGDEPGGKRPGPPRLRAWLELHRLPSERLRHVATLTLAVAPGWRRRGLGSKLLASGYGWARDVGVVKIGLNVRAGNEAAIRLYQREGFVLEGRERRQIRTREGFEDNLLMARFLAE